MSPYDDQSVSAGEIADYLHSQSQLMIPAIHALTEAFEELEEWCDDHEDKVPEQLLPSALVVTVDPRSTPNASTRICGEPEHLVQALLIAAQGNEAFRDALTDALPQIMDLASQRT